VTFANVTEDHTLSATFAIDTYTLISAACLHGTITPNGVQTVDHGTSSTFTITPDTGYHIADVLKDGVSIGASSSVTFANVTADHTLSATFAANPVTLSTKTRLSGPSSVKVRKKLKLSGTVTPASAPGTVTIVKQRLVGRKWKSAGTVKVKVTKGKFSYTFKPTKRGKWRFVATYTGGKVGITTYKASKSTTRNVRVR
jgi:hypothetical protein